MKEWKQSLLRVQEDGMEAIEGLLVITLTLFVLFFIWGYGFLLFQQFVVDSVWQFLGAVWGQRHARLLCDGAGDVHRSFALYQYRGLYQDVELCSEQRCKE